MNEIKVRKPKPILFYGFAKVYERYTNRFYKWMQKLPNEGDRIRITWFPDNNGVTNAYIGFEGIVKQLNKIEGAFIIDSGNSILVCHGDFNYIYLG